MKTMKDFAAQQLTKKQMNDVRGGRFKVICNLLVEDPGEPGKLLPGGFVVGYGETSQDAYADAIIQTQGYVIESCDTYVE